MEQYDLVIIGSGPGGHGAAFRASELGLKTAIVEKAELGGVCLNWGCIPTKALLKSAAVLQYCNTAALFGVNIGGEVKPDLQKMVERSRGVVEMMNKGVDFLLKKHHVDVYHGFGLLKGNGIVEILTSEMTCPSNNISASHIIIATGASSRHLPNLPQDGEKIIGYREAMTLQQQPETLLVVGSGAIGSEFAYFYQSIGTKVTLVEYMPNIVPLEDTEASAALSRAFRKMGMKIMTDANVLKVNQLENGKLTSEIQTKKGIEILETDIVLSAVGIEPSIKGIGLEECGVEIEKNRIKVDEFYRTNVEGVYAIGDIIVTPALAHVASMEAIVCVEKIAGKDVRPVNYGIVPSCIYTHPEIASVGLSEQRAIEKGRNVKVGKFQFMASGKATATGNRDGFVRVVADAESDVLLGCTMVGDNVTEMIAEVVVLLEKQVTTKEILRCIHPHPTMSEGFLEAVRMPV